MKKSTTLYKKEFELTDCLFKEYNKSISTNGMISIYPDVAKESRKENRICKDRL